MILQSSQVAAALAAIYRESIDAKNAAERQSRQGISSSAAFNFGIVEGCEHALNQFAQILGMEPAELRVKLAVHVGEADPKPAIVVAVVSPRRGEC
jgi:glucokinase